MGRANLALQMEAVGTGRLSGGLEPKYGWVEPRLTAQGAVGMLITELGVFRFKPDGGGMMLVEIAPGVSLDDLRAATAAEFEVSHDLRQMA